MSKLSVIIFIISIVFYIGVTIAEKIIKNKYRKNDDEEK